jgi:hypothetical protein
MIVRYISLLPRRRRRGIFDFEDSAQPLWVHRLLVITVATGTLLGHVPEEERKDFLSARTYGSRV